LAVKDQEALLKLSSQLKERNVDHVLFYEPDVDQHTSIGFFQTEKTVNITRYLPLANKLYGKIDKHVVTREHAIHMMKTTKQFDTQTVWEHGQSVKEITLELINDLKNKTDRYSIIPECFKEHSEKILDNLYSNQIIEEYCVFHDISKPFCISIDEMGKRHFFDHANKSYEIYRQISDNQIVANLIKDDMLIHTIKDNDLENFLKKPVKQITTHLVVGLAELISNSKFFGGMESDSFKIKYKQLLKRSKKILSI